MSFQRIQDVVNKKSSNLERAFKGMHYGYGATDQPEEYGNVCDFDVKGGKLELRHGCVKAEGWGYPASVNALFTVELREITWVGVLDGGSILLYKLDDVLSGIRRYYTVDEVANTFTVSELTAKTVNDLINGGGR